MQSTPLHVPNFDGLFRSHLRNLHPNFLLQPEMFQMSERRKAYKTGKVRALYSRADFHDALMPRQHTAQSIEFDMRQWVELRRGLAFVCAAAGLGKTSAVANLFNLYNPLEQRLIYCSDTTENRDEFLKKVDPSKVFVIPSNAEIITKHYPEFDTKVRARMAKLYSAQNYVQRTLKEVLASMGFLADGARNAAIEAEHEFVSDQLVNRTKHLVMTSAKFKAIRTFSRNGWVLDEASVFIDEPKLFELSPIPVGEVYRVYGQDREIKGRIGFVPDFDVLRAMNICYLSTEPNVGMEMRRLGLPHMCIGEAEKVFDAGLTVAVVDSTSGYKERDAEIVKAVRHHWDGVFISNRWPDAADENHVSVKGSNEYIGEDSVTMLTMPSAIMIAETMACYDLREEDAIRLILTNQFNQAVCRSVGLRNVTGEVCCLAIVSEKIFQYLDPLVVTTEVFTKGSYQRARNPSNRFATLLDHLFQWKPTTALGKVPDGQRSAFLTELDFRLTAGNGSVDLKTMESGWSADISFKTMLKLVEGAGYTVEVGRPADSSLGSRGYWVSRTLH